MKAIMLMFDTLSRNYLPNYGNRSINAPNFERLKNRCITFEQFYGGSMPCMPARRELHTGKYNFLHRSWGPLEPFDFSVFEQLNKEGIYTHLVTDHSHYWEDGGATYHNRYSTWEGFRGQEGDRWQPRSKALPNENEHPLNKNSLSVTQHFANRTKQMTEDELSTVRTVQAGLDFLDTYKKEDDWFLQIECFDPHEPFYLPDESRKHLNQEKNRLYWPKYQQVESEDVTDDLQDVQKEYKALVELCDKQLGKVLDFMDEYRMWEDTLLIVNTDHGFLLGEHDWMGKNFSPMYEEVIHIPFFLHVPGYNQAYLNCREIAQTIDIPPTLLDYFGLKIPENMEGKSLLNLLKEESKREDNHQNILFGMNGGHICIYDGRYIYMRAAANEDNQPLVNYTLMPTMIRGFIPESVLKEMELVSGNKFSNGIPMLKFHSFSFMNSYKFGNLLFDMKKDPKQKHPLEDEAIEKQMISKLIKRMKEIEAPEEEYIRLGLEDDRKKQFDYKE